MSIEQKIAEILAESKKQKLDEFKVAGKEGGQDSGKDGAQAGDQTPIRTAQNTVPNGGETPNPDNARNNVQDEKDAENAPTGKMNPHNGDQKPVRPMKEDIDAMLGDAELTEEFKTKAATIFEAAVLARVAEEAARIQEEFEAKLAEQVEQNTQGIVEQVDGYLGYMAEQWMAQNEIALEQGMKSEILEGFVNGLKGLFEEHYIDIPEERFDVLGEMENKIAELESKINEQVEVNVELTKTLAEAKRAEIVGTVSEGLTDTETEKFLSLAKEIAFEDSESFETKLKTIRESYFTAKQLTEVKSVVTDAPVEVLTESKAKAVDPVMAQYLSALNK
jgi:uncharacterized coiled-coil protein SlyX